MSNRDNDKELCDFRFQMMMRPSEIAAIDDWMFANRLRSRAKAIRILIGNALSKPSVGIAAPTMREELERQRAWLLHWIEDVRSGLKLTPESLEKRLADVEAALAKTEGQP